MAEIKKELNEEDIEAGLIEEEEDSNFSIVTISDCMKDKIRPSELLSSPHVSMNISWTQLIALLNRKSKSGKLINSTQDYPAMKAVNLYYKMISKGNFF